MLYMLSASLWQILELFILQQSFALSVTSKDLFFKDYFFLQNLHSNYELFSNVGWAGNINDRRSKTRYCLFLGDSLITWSSQKQHVVARSSTKAEYSDLADTTAEIIWLRWLLADICVHLVTPTLRYCDNKSAIQIARNDVFHTKE